MLARYQTCLMITCAREVIPLTKHWTPEWRQL